jgi:hypothetical protein
LVHLKPDPGSGVTTKNRTQWLQNVGVFQRRDENAKPQQLWRCPIRRTGRFSRGAPPRPGPPQDAGAIITVRLTGARLKSP